MDEDRNTTGIYSDLRLAPYDMTRDQRLQLLTKMALTDNTRNTVKEELVLETVENFRAQYVALYPTRAPLLLSPENEYGCRKFISTFIRPSQLKFDELYDWHTLSKFIANYIQYEDMGETTTLPTSVTSPTTTMQWQVGNAIEMAILLASLLIGDGYNAYVCVGYAKRPICLNDQTETPWPDALPAEVNPDDVVTPKPKPVSDYVQFLKERPKLISAFDEQERKYGTHKILSDDDDADKTNNNGGADGEDDAFNATNMDLENRLVHAWVMVRPDRRRLAEPKTDLIKRLNLNTNVPFLGIPSTSIFHDSTLPAVGRKEGDKIIIETRTTKNASKDTKFIEEPIFIEPATATFMRASDVNASLNFYEGIEAIFNKENYFVNMNPLTPVHKLSMDLKDLTAWERIFLADASLATDGAEEDGIAGGGAMTSPNDTLRKAAGTTSKLGGTVSSMAGTLSGGLGGVGAGGGAEPTSVVGEGGDQALDLQLSWVAPITLSLQQYSNRYPDRRKEVQYAGVHIEMFAEYSEPDLKVLTVTIDIDDEGRYGAAASSSSSVGHEVHTFYKHRSDRMRRKSIFPQGSNNNATSNNALLGGQQQGNMILGGTGFTGIGLGGASAGGAGIMAAGHTVGGAGRGSLIRTHYWFEPGRMHEGTHRVEGLRELIVEMGVQRTMRFYWKSRDDGLAMRIERFAEGGGVGGGAASRNVPIKVKEYYKGRGEDFLVYRSAKYDLPREGGGGLGVATTTLTSKDHRLDPIKMSEKFARCPATPIDADVEKRVYIKPQSNEGEIWCKYHYRPGCITRGIRLYPKNFDREKDLTAAAMIAKDQGRDSAVDVQPYVVLMPDMEKPKDTDLLNELRVLVDKETECLNEIRAKSDDCKDILAQLNLEREEQQSRDAASSSKAGGGGGASSSNGGSKDKNQRDNALISIFDTLRGRTKETEAEIAQRKAEELRRAESRKDYLAPFIAKQENMAKICKGDYTNAKLSLEMARKVRDEAIADLKERLIERGHIMQSRLDKEREDLMRRQMAFQKAIDGSDGTKESEEFSRFGKEATWRIRILEERLSNYIKSSADKYRQLADRLANDKRLAALYTSGEQR